MRIYIYAIFLFFSFNAYSQSVMFSGYVKVFKGDNIINAEKTNNFVIITINHPNTINYRVNKNSYNYKIVSHTLTDSGRYLKYILINNQNEKMITYMRFISEGRLIITFNWVPADNTMGYIMVKPTDDDKRILGINSNL